MADWDQASMGLEVAVGSMSVGAANWNAVNFMMDNASMIVGWKRAGLTYPQIARAMNDLGFSISSGHVRNVFGKISPLAKESEVVAFKLAIHRRFLSQSRPSPSSVQPALTQSHASTASMVDTQPHLAHAVQSMPKPAIRPTFSIAAAKVDALVPIEGEDEDVDSTAATKLPRSFGEFRRRLWASMKAEKPSPIVDYGDGECLQIPSGLHRPLFEGKFRNWSEFIAKI